MGLRDRIGRGFFHDALTFFQMPAEAEIPSRLGVGVGLAVAVVYRSRICSWRRCNGRVAVVRLVLPSRFGVAGDVRWLSLTRRGLGSSLRLSRRRSWSLTGVVVCGRVRCHGLAGRSRKICVGFAVDVGLRLKCPSRSASRRGLGRGVGPLR